MNKLRILFTIPNFNTAGSGKVLYDLVNGLNPEKFSIEIACEDNKGAFFKDVQALGFPIHIVKTKTPLRPYWSLLFRIIKITRFYKKQNYDLIHSWQWSSDWTEALAARLAGCKWIYTKKAMGFKSKHWKIKSWLAHYIITINDDMRGYFPKKKLQQLIPLGIDTDYYSNQNKNSLDQENFNVITVANLVPVKGVEVLIKAIDLIPNKHIRLTIIGDTQNPYGEQVKALVKSLNLKNRVSFLGKKMDVRPYLSKSNLYIIPTLNQGRREGMPMALVEAMSIGIPVLGSNISGIKYVLKDFQHLLVEPGNAEALKQKILYIESLDATTQKDLGVSLRNYCIDNFPIDKFISNHEVLYHQLLKN